jgi:hypothetical protein
MRYTTTVATFTTVGLLAAAGGLGVSTLFASAASTAQGSHSFSFYAFDISNDTNDPGFVRVAGGDPGTIVQGDESIVNDQITSTRKSKGGYPIVGHDSGVCTFTRLPAMNAAKAMQTLSDCTVTAVLPHGSLTAQGVLVYHSQVPAAVRFAVTGGTGRYSLARGTVSIRFTKDYKILRFTLAAA